MSLPVGMDACSYYRVKQPLEQIKLTTEHDTHVIDYKHDDMVNLVKVFPEVDVFYTRPGSEKGLSEIRSFPEIPIKAKIVVDIDDNLELINPTSQFYAEYGLKEIEYHGKPVWKNNSNGFSIFKNYIRKTYVEYGLRKADLVVVTTDKLAEHALKFNKNVFVNDNTIDFTKWWRLNNKINAPLKVIWQGSPSHYNDWYSIKDPLNTLLREFNFELYMLGSQYQGIIDEDLRHRVHALPWVPFEAHSYRMMALQADIALIPLANDEFNHYKSSIKWYEMSAMGVPSVVSNVEPYSKCIQHGKTALGYSNEKEFCDSLKALLTNKGLRKNIGNSAYQWVKDNKDVTKESKKLSERLEELCK